MARRSFPVYDFAAFGIKGMLKHVRLFILAILGFVATMLAAMGVMALIAYPLVEKLFFAGRDLSFDMMTCVNRQECFGAFGRMCQTVCPTLAGSSLLVSLAGLFFFVVMIWLGTGMIRILLDLVDKDKSSVRKLWGTFRFVPRFFVAGIFSAIAIGIGFMLFVIPGIWLLTRLFFFKFYIIDKDAGVIECFRKSFHATRGLEWDIVAILIVGFTLMFLAPIIGLPAFALMSTAAYRKVQK